MAGSFTPATGNDIHFRGYTDGGPPTSGEFVCLDLVQSPSGFLLCLTGGPAASATWCDLSEIPSTGIISDTAYDATTWNGVTGVAPSKNAVRDKIEALAGATVDTAPWLVDIIPGASTPIDSANFTLLIRDNAVIHCCHTLSDGTQNAYACWDVILSAGTWTVEVLSSRSTDRAIGTITLDGVSVGTFDTYGSFLAATNYTVTGIVVAASGKKRLKIQAATKNASSSGYALDLVGIQWRKTAP